MPVLTVILILWLLIINAVAFAMFGIDKRRARNRAWRISERALFLPAILGGSLGALCGMHLFRHKTKHWYFRCGLPLLLLLHLGLGLWLAGVIR